MALTHTERFNTWGSPEEMAQLTPDANGTSVEMTVSDNFGAEVRSGMEGRYNELMQARPEAIKDALS